VDTPVRLRSPQNKGSDCHIHISTSQFLHFCISAFLHYHFCINDRTCTERAVSLAILLHRQDVLLDLLEVLVANSLQAGTKVFVRVLRQLSTIAEKRGIPARSAETRPNPPNGRCHA